MTVHGAAGTFDVPLPLDGPAGIEPRNSPGDQTNKHQVVFKFGLPATFTGASVTPAPGQTADLDGDPTFDPAKNEVTVKLKNVSNAQTINVSLLGVTAGSAATNISVPMGVLLGDVNQTGTVDGNDVSAVQGSTRQPVNNTNFRRDVNVSGLIDGNDVSAVQSRTRTRLP